MEQDTDHFLDLIINISDNNKLVFKIYNKTDDFNFEEINFPFLESNIHSNITYSAYYSQLLRYAKICSNYTDFKHWRVKKVKPRNPLRQVVLLLMSPNETYYLEIFR